MPPHIVDIPANARVDTFFTPPFRTRPPDLRHGNLIPPDLQALYATLWHQSHGPTEVVASVLCGAYVDGPGLVFDQDLNLIRQTIHQATPEEIETAFHAVRDAAGRVPLQRGVTLLCEKTGIGNYGHWLVEMLPVASLNLRHLFRGGWQLRLPVASEAMNRVTLDSVRLAGVPGEQLAFRRPGPQYYEQLVIVHGLSQHGVWYSPLIVDCLEQIASSVPARPSAGVWFSRAGSRRVLKEEAAVCARLRQEGWEIAMPGSLSLADQIALAKGAPHVAGVNGAGLTNLVFAPRGATVTSFMPAPMPDVFFWMLAGFKGQSYVEVRCPQEADEGGWNAPLTMAVDEVLAQLGL